MKLETHHAITHGLAAISGALFVAYPMLAVYKPRTFKLPPEIVVTLSTLTAALIFVFALGTAGSIEEVRSH